MFVGVASEASSEVSQRFVRPGETVVLAQSKDKLELTGTGVGTARVLSETNTAGETSWALTYTAPTSPTVTQDTVAFTGGGQAQSVIIELSALNAADDPNVIGRAGRILFAMLVVAVVLESAFAVIFNWRVFLEFFDGRGVRTLLMFLGAYLIVATFRQDYVGQLFAVYSGGEGRDSGAATQLLTALVLAGGSASVNSLMVSLNLRQNRSAEEVVEKPPKTKAWIAVGVRLKDAVNVVEIVRNEKSSGDTSREELVGVVRPTGFWERLSKYFWRDVRRFPMNGGFEVEPGKEYAIVIVGRDRDGNEILCDATGQRLVRKPTLPERYEPPPRSYVFAPGAIVDFNVTL